MAINLTGQTIASTYSQLLHVDGGPTAGEKVVYSGTGVATALKVGTGSASVDNLQLDGNTIISTDTNGNINLTPNGTGTVVVSKADIQSGTIVSNNATITGGAISNVTFTGTFSGITAITSDSFFTGDAAAGLTLTGNELTADGTDTNIDVEITPKGTGSVVIPKIAVTDGTVPFNTITNRAYASFFDAGTTDQTGSTTDRTAVEWATAAVTGAGITVASDSRITLAAAGTYRINASLQFFNSDNTVRTVDLWFATNGTNIADSGARITVPANNAGGTNLVAYEIFVTVAANDYVEMYWYPSNVSATLHYIAPVASNPGVTPAIPAVPPAIVVVQRIA
jgi:hypothetical protein